MNKLIRHKSPIFKVITLFFAWRFILIAITLFATNFIPLGSTDRYLGAGLVNFKLSPQLFSLANFDGEHYLSIAIFGYKSLQQAFFPFYPMLISLFARPFSHDLFSSLLSSTIFGLIISNGSFLLALYLLFELIEIDFSRKISFITIIMILIFPTSFYFGALYSESLFLLLSVSSFYFARKGNWLLSSITGFFASTTRVFGILLLPTLLIEAYQQKVKLNNFFWLFLIPFGLGIYMYYQYLTVGDALAFYHLQKIVGEQHQSGLIFLPQVYFRYVKMILTVDKFNPIYQTIWLEFISGLLFFALPIYGYFKKIRISYLFYAIIGFLLPVIQGSFSSTPRYVIVLFPSFIALAIFWNNLSKLFKILFLIIFSSLLVSETSLFLRGYWVA